MNDLEKLEEVGECGSYTADRNSYSFRKKTHASGLLLKDFSKGQPPLVQSSLYSHHPQNKAARAESSLLINLSRYVGFFL